jgi:aspartyl-tRNA(Asn)/glutamyl-tRNA(Gln) amidotransferase subunit A
MFTLVDAAAQLRDRKLSSVELTQACLDRIAKLNPALNAFITVTAESALAEARAVDAEIAAGNYRGPLHGIPIALKDLIDVAGVRTTAASRQLEKNIPTQDAALVAQLKRAGAVLVGKTNLHEFAFGVSGIVSAYGPVRNPWDKTRITGGSSSGSAAAVAAGMCVAAIGTDTAGSIRTPASLCGIVGHRPSAGVWSTDGVFPLRPAFDTVGPMTRTVADTEILLRALSGQSAAAIGSDEPIRIGVARNGFFDHLDPGVTDSVRHAIAVLGALVGPVRDVTVKVDVSWSTFDREILQIHRTMIDQSPNLYEPATLARMKACARNSVEDYESAKAALPAARRDAEALFDDVDIIATPTCVVPAPTIEDLQAMPALDLRAYEVKYLLRNTAPFSLLFWPTVSVPCGFTGDGLPVGLQITARPGADNLALHVARVYQQATAWHKRLPPIAR